MPTSVPINNSETGELETVIKEGETDVLVVFETQTHKRIALHIENKLASGSFTPFQPEIYAARAAQWKGNPDYQSYEDWETVLIAPRSFYARYIDDAKKFGRFIAHEDIANYIRVDDVTGRGVGDVGGPADGAYRLDVYSKDLQSVGLDRCTGGGEPGSSEVGLEMRTKKRTIPTQKHPKIGPYENSKSLILWRRGRDYSPLTGLALRAAGKAGVLHGFAARRTEPIYFRGLESTVNNP
jgi:hypothetical protein